MNDMDVLNSINDAWPQFHITDENLSHPTEELVIKFYNLFLNDYNDIIQYLTGVPVSNDVSMEPEECLFQQLSKLLKFQSLEFTLSDIYSPAPLRTKAFFKVCMHFLSFVQHMSSERDIIENKVFMTQADMSKLLLELEDLLNEINENARNKELNERNKICLQEDYKATKNSYKEMKELKASKEKLCAEKKQQIETLKWEMQNEDHELKRLETIENNLSQQRITEKDYHNILQTVETLKVESEMLDNNDVNIGDGLLYENEVLRHSAHCLHILKQFDFDVQNVKDLINEEKELKVISSTVQNLNENKQNFIEQQKPEGENKFLILQESLVTLRNEHNDIKELYKHSINQFFMEIDRFKNEMEEESQNRNKTTLKYKENQGKLNEDMAKLKNAFINEYIKVSNVERRVMNKFRDMLMKCNEL